MTEPRSQAPTTGAAPVTLFLCGDVMLGRGIDQILPHPCAPELRERYIGSALDYVSLAERAHGPIPRAVEPAHVWGVSLEEMERVQPAARIINLETSITCSDDFVPKGINYRLSPANAACLAAAKIDCCVVANNHILDFGRAGLDDTLSTLARIGVKPVGAGRDLPQASTPAVIDIGRSRRLIVAACGAVSSGIPRSWAARADRPGVQVTDLSEADAARIIEQVARVRRPGDIIVVSIHWGPNWGYDIPQEQRRFAHRLIEGGVSVVHGHSSHHAKAIEIHRGRLILYGCGDFLNDYEGIGGYEQFRSDLSLMYFATIDLSNGALAVLEMVPMQVRRFRLALAPQEDIGWLHYRLEQESGRFGTRIDLAAGGKLIWRPRLVQ